jgi:hypothetical protein
MSYSLLHTKAREAMRGGNLPLRFPDKLSGGPAAGERCAVCGESTTPGKMVLEIEFTPDSQAGRTRLQFHPLCFGIYSRELERFPERVDNVGAEQTGQSEDHNVGS